VVLLLIGLFFVFISRHEANFRQKTVVMIVYDFPVPFTLILLKAFLVRWRIESRTQASWWLPSFWLWKLQIIYFYRDVLNAFKLVWWFSFFRTLLWSLNQVSLLFKGSNSVVCLFQRLLNCFEVKHLAQWLRLSKSWIYEIFVSNWIWQSAGLVVRLASLVKHFIF